LKADRAPDGELNYNTATMSKAVRHLFLTFLLFAPTAFPGETKSPQEVEKLGINQIAQLTSKEHSTILFSIADCSIGYAKAGRVDWIKTDDQCGSGRCSWPHPSLSHDGSHVAFVISSDTPQSCRIVIQDMRTGIQRELVETTDDPGEISWSWDDAELAFFDRGISAVSVRDGAKRVLLPFPLKKIGTHEFTYRIWNPMQWLHNGKDLVVELTTEIPTKQVGTFTEQSNLLFISGGDARVIDIGSQPAVSPISDRIAYYASEGVAAINADATGKTVLREAPRGLLFGKDDLFWKIVWSPDGNRLFFGTIVSENRRDNLYMLDAKSGRRESFISHTSITIRGWR
jgi:hypothetical protein